MIRVGMGYDVHKLVEGRDLILGGVKIPWEKGLLGHSDADVLLHAIMDALLGAAALGDIGKHFPDTDAKYKGISSIKLLKYVGTLLEEHMYVINNIDATIVAQKPKMRPHIDAMIENVADALHIEKNQQLRESYSLNGKNKNKVNIGKNLMFTYILLFITVIQANMNWQD